MSMAVTPKPGGAPPRPRWASVRWLGLAGMLLAAIIVPFVLLEDRLNHWTQAALGAAQAEPWLGGGLVIALLAGDIALPVPSSLVSTFAGGAFGWSAGALVIWIGMSLGCVVGYGLGASAGRVFAMRIVGEGDLARAGRLLGDVGPSALILTRAVPVLAEAGVLAAGATGMPVGRFLVATGLANAAVAVAYAGVGAAAVTSGSFLIAFIGLASIPAAALTAWRVAAVRRGARSKREKT